MTKTKSIKRSLIASIVVLCILATSLIGTTFAWFTDEVTNSGNKIKAGTLKVDLEYHDAKNDTWVSLKDDKNPIYNYEKWEPGYTDVKLFKVVNEGTLALKWKAKLNTTATLSELATVIEVYVRASANEPTYPATRDFAAEGFTYAGTLDEFIRGVEDTTWGTLLANESAYLTLALKMKESAGNEFQGKDLGGTFDIQIVATQLTAELDSFDDQYDKDAEFSVDVKNADELKAALAAGGNIVLTNDIIISESLPVTNDTVLDLNGKNIGTSGSTTGSPLYLRGGKLTVKNGTLDLDGSHTNVNGTFSTAIGYDAQTELVVENVNFTGTTAINGTFATDGPLKIAISDCTMDVTSVGIAVSANSTEAIATINNCNIDADEYAIFASQGSKITINGGTYKSAGKVITSMYNNTVVTINGGTFDGELWVTGGGSLVIYGGTFTADPSAYVAPGYQVTDNGNGTWTVDEYKVSTGAELVDAIANGKAVELTQDVQIGKINLTGAITNDVVIDANGHKITTTDAYGIEVAAGKNVTISNADVEMTKAGDYITYAAGFKIANGDYAGATITLENCTITMANTDWAYSVNMPANVKNLNLVIDNCTLEGAIAVQCWGDNNTITITNSKLICNYTTNAMYTSYCVVLQDDGSYAAENNTLVIDNCEFLYSGIDNFNSEIKAVADMSGSNTVTVTNCTYGEKVVAD